MFNPQLVSRSTASLAGVEASQIEAHWYAVYNLPRHEKKVAALLRQKGVNSYLPVVAQMHWWSDRSRVVQVPLFPGYAFVRISMTAEMRLLVLRTAGVIGFVAMGGIAVPVPDEQIEDIQRILLHRVPCVLYPFLRVGQRVRIHGGCLEGLEGILVSRNADRSLVVSIETIQQSLAIRIEGYDVEILAPPQNPLRTCRRGATAGSDGFHAVNS